MMNKLLISLKERKLKMIYKVSMKKPNFNILKECMCIGLWDWELKKANVKRVMI
jgi:hypothetical protein